MQTGDNSSHDPMGQFSYKKGRLTHLFGSVQTKLSFLPTLV